MNSEIILAFVGILGTVVSLVVWMIKLSAKRSEQITDQFIATLHRQNEQSDARSTQFIEAMERMSEQLHEVADKLSEVVVQVRELAAEVADLKREPRT